MAGGLKPRQRALFFGPPGCGKTLAAQALAGVLAYPLVTVRVDAVVSSYLGETAANLRRVFEFIQTCQWVVLFDEFDAIRKDRDNTFEHGELKRVVNTQLQLIDAFLGESLLIAAANHETLLDKGVGRRFEAVVQFPVPAPHDRILLLRQFLRGFDATALNLDPWPENSMERPAPTSRGFASRPRGWRCPKAETRSAVKISRRLWIRIAK